MTVDKTPDAAERLAAMWKGFEEWALATWPAHTVVWSKDDVPALLNYGDLLYEWSAYQHAWRAGRGE